MIPTCQSCAFWSSEAPFMQPERFHQRMCTCPKLQEGFFEGTPTDVLCYSYQEDGRFYTGADFGCVHHERRES